MENFCMRISFSSWLLSSLFPRSFKKAAMGPVWSWGGGWVCLSPGLFPELPHGMPVAHLSLCCCCYHGSSRVAKVTPLLKQTPVKSWEADFSLQFLRHWGMQTICIIIIEHIPCPQGKREFIWGSVSTATQACPGRLYSHCGDCRDFCGVKAMGQDWGKPDGFFFVVVVIPASARPAPFLGHQPLPLAPC